MVAPLAIAGGAMAVNAIAQLYMSEKQRKADKARLKEIEAIFRKILPPNIDVSIEDWATKSKDLLPDLSGIPMPDFSGLTPKEYKIIAQYTPELAPYVEEQNPELIKRSEVGEEGLSAQRQALRKMMMSGSLEQDPELMQAFAEADRQAQISAQSRQQSALQDAARRGQLGGGQQLLASMAGGADAMDRLSQSTQGAAAQAYRNRLNQLSRGADLGRGMEQTDINLQGRNVDAINNFNQRMSKNYQDYLNRRADTSNDAQYKNLQASQNVADANVDLQNKWARDQAELGKWTYGQKKGNLQADFENKISGMDTENRAKTSRFGSLMEKAKGMAGIPSVNPWGDYKQIAQGGSDFVTQYAAQMQARNDFERGQDREDRRAQYERTGTWPAEEK